MSHDSARKLHALTAFEQLRYARDIIQLEAQALTKVSQRLDGAFCEAVGLVAQCRGSVVVSGMGKAGLIGQKISATLASTGSRSIFLHPADAVHGDLGRVRSDDCLLLLSQSGETEEIVRLLPLVARLEAPIVALTARQSSTLGRRATVTIELGPLREACPLGLAPSTSTTAMLAVGDALALVASRLRGFGQADFARVHPAGSLGLQLSRVEEQMRPLAECRVAAEDRSVRDVFAELRRPGRRSGAIMLVEGDEPSLAGAHAAWASRRLTGLFTDSDLARLFEARRDQAFDRPIREVMTPRPATVAQGSMLLDAVAIMAERKISELPVVDAAGAPVGMLDITDLVRMIPETPAAAGG